MISKQQLIDFEADIAHEFNTARIRAPVHLYSGVEDQMITVFEHIDVENDWVCCTWRNHYQALLKGVPPKYLKDKIMQGKSMVMNLPEYKFICSSIVGGIPSIATGLALAAKLRGTGEKVWCWCGDMSAQTGAFIEAHKYSYSQNLPITFVIEDNGMSVMTPTKSTWGTEKPQDPHLIYYQYTNDLYPHAGAGVRVQF
ncbi:PDH_E1_alph_y, pyruvate dehydrogenase (acetyl-transferring) E1 component, alpha subunit [uncultured Caudovirales phage]|uniref:PDH_E1_alph_y, pyruvate dehydrogenase (Acetyl-transferring) E1 component, alpha subunit n=1 Tax=uncultured Caudovirales phage TaxID=2100421 RepID=A0A6J5KL30_9CAUD|nr:PDH_E1_alph_y, pyruvate dehydrogenase (acetyl-transferring) E1 component, alpha subunit [uncultured Caudovirales phage]